MKKSISLCMVLAISLLLPIATAYAGHKKAGEAKAHRQVRAEDKAASDGHMKDGLAALQAGSIQEAVTDMKQALPIYHGWRIKSIHSAEKALADSTTHVGAEVEKASLAKAISDAQTALSNSSAEYDR